MGNLVENERIKLRATFLNNLAVGSVVAGILVPYLVFIQQTGEFVEWIIGWSRGTSQFAFSEVAKVITTVLGMLMARSGARYFRQAANEEISKIRGDASN